MPLYGFYFSFSATAPIVALLITAIGGWKTKGRRAT